MISSSIVAPWYSDPSTSFVLCYQGSAVGKTRWRDKTIHLALFQMHCYVKLHFAPETQPLAQVIFVSIVVINTLSIIAIPGQHIKI